MAGLVAGMAGSFGVSLAATSGLGLAGVSATIIWAINFSNRASLSRSSASPPPDDDPAPAPAPAFPSRVTLPPSTFS